MASGVTTQCAWPGRGKSVTELMPFMNFLVHSYTCCNNRHASPYWTLFVDEFRWVSPLHYLGNRWQHCSSLVHVASGAAIFTLLLRRRVAFLHCAATCRPLFKPWVSLLSTYKTMELCFKFLSHFKFFIWLSLIYPSAVDNRDSIMYEQSSIVWCDAVSGYSSQHFKRSCFSFRVNSPRRNGHMKIWLCYICIDTGVGDMNVNVGPVGL
jgi:hypothetical protein